MKIKTMIVELMNERIRLQKELQRVETVLQAMCPEENQPEMKHPSQAERIQTLLRDMAGTHLQPREIARRTRIPPRSAAQILSHLKQSGHIEWERGMGYWVTARAMQAMEGE